MVGNCLMRLAQGPHRMFFCICEGRVCWKDCIRQPPASHRLPHFEGFILVPLPGTQKAAKCNIISVSVHKQVAPLKNCSEATECRTLHG
jgi:hypothetical protein